MAGRLLYGYRVAGSTVAVEPREAAVVCAVLSVPSSKRFGLATSFIGQLLPELSADARKQLAHRIRRHSIWYRLGKPSRAHRPESRLVIAGQFNHAS